jgi:phage-related protein
MRYELFVCEETREQLRELADDIRRSVGYRLQVLQDG